MVSKQICRIDGSLLKWKKYVIEFFIFIELTGLIFFPFQLDTIDITNGGNRSIQLIYMLFYVVFGCFVFLDIKKTLIIVVNNRLLIVLLFLPLVSVLWSDAPLVTLRRSIALIGTGITGLMLAALYTPKELFLSMARMLALSSIVSFVYILVFPNAGMDVLGGKVVWTGFFSNKNLLASNIAISLIVWIMLSFFSQKKKFLYIGFAVVQSFVLFKTNSMTSIVLAIASINIFILLKHLKKSGTRGLRVIIPVVIATVCLLFLLKLVFFDFDFTLDSFVQKYLGRNLTLTGRIYFWLDILPYIKESLFLGHGYASNWQGYKLDAGNRWGHIFQASHLHNGYIQLAFDLGLLGLAVYMVVFIKTIIKCVKYLWEDGNPENYFPIIYIFMFTLVNINEYRLLRHNNFYWYLFCAISFVLSTRFSKKDEIMISSNKYKNNLIS